MQKTQNIYSSLDKGTRQQQSNSQLNGQSKKKAPVAAAAVVVAPTPKNEGKKKKNGNGGGNPGNVNNNGNNNNQQKKQAKKKSNNTTNADLVEEWEPIPEHIRKEWEREAEALAKRQEEEERKKKEEAAASSTTAMYEDLVANGVLTKAQLKNIKKREKKRRAKQQQQETNKAQEAPLAPQEPPQAPLSPKKQEPPPDPTTTSPKKSSHEPVVPAASKAKDSTKAKSPSPSTVINGPAVQPTEPTIAAPTHPIIPPIQSVFSSPLPPILSPNSSTQSTRPIGPNSVSDPVNGITQQLDSVSFGRPDLQQPNHFQPLIPTDHFGGSPLVKNSIPEASVQQSRLLRIWRQGNTEEDSEPLESTNSMGMYYNSSSWVDYLNQPEETTPVPQLFQQNPFSFDNLTQNSYLNGTSPDYSPFNGFSNNSDYPTKPYTTFQSSSNRLQESLFELDKQKYVPPHRRDRPVPHHTPAQKPPRIVPPPPGLHPLFQPM